MGDNIYIFDLTKSVSRMVDDTQAGVPQGDATAPPPAGHRAWWLAWAAAAAASPQLPASAVVSLSAGAAAAAGGSGAAPFRPISIVSDWFFCGGDSAAWDGLLD